MLEVKISKYQDVDDFKDYILRGKYQTSLNKSRMAWLAVQENISCVNMHKAQCNKDEIVFSA